MTITRFVLAAALAAVTVGQVPTSAQLRVRPVDEHGRVALGLKLRQLGSIGTFMMTTAHPDDENNGLLAALSHGHGIRTTLVTATRGEGGQNEIGPELFEALAVLRTEELAAAHRFDGAEQYFTRAADFGYSFSIDETYERWGREEILRDFVGHIRRIRPDVVVGFLWDGPGGGQHHQASSQITAEAFRAAADPGRFPEQIADGLRPWQAKKFYYTERFFGMRGEAPPPPPPGVRLLQVNSSVYDPLLGRTYAEMGAEARSMHKCQGMPQLLPLPGSLAVLRYRLQDTVLPGRQEQDETWMFDGIDTGFTALSRFAGDAPPAALTRAVEAIAATVAEARAALDARGPHAAAPPLARGLSAVRDLRAQLASLGLDETAAYEIAFRLAQKEEQFQDALLLAYGVRIDAIAGDGIVVRGQPVTLSILAAARGGEPVAVQRVSVAGFDGVADACPAGPIEAVGGYRCTAEVRVPSEARFTRPYFRRAADVDRYEVEEDAPFGLPFRPTPFRVAIEVSLSGVAFPVDIPVQYRYEGNIFSGEKRSDVKVVPAFAVRITPDIAVVPIADAREGREREVRVTVANGSPGPAEGEVELQVPEGWRVSPASAQVAFSREDEQVTLRFAVAAPSQVSPGEIRIAATVRHAGEVFGEGYQVVEYPHTRRRHVMMPAEASMKVLDVQTTPGLTVGYITGVGDQVPPALEQLGARLELIDGDTLAWGDLSRYHVIMTGVRAYERRADLRANNHRLLEYARQGGTVLVQYNKFEFNEAQYGPFPAKVSSNRVTDETAPVRVLVPEHPVFTTPNRIGDAAWQNWVQERGLYFLGERDPQYVDLVETEDPFEYNKGPKRGALVEARVGKGRWVYIGLGLWRQLPAGTDGAYELMANLLALGKADPSDPTAARQ
jgi:LmbE family N-acetylglucosaminyl deacetylase